MPVAARGTGMRARNWTKSLPLSAFMALTLAVNALAARVDLSGTGGLGTVIDSLSSQTMASFTLAIDATVYLPDPSTGWLPDEIYVYTIEHNAAFPLEAVTIDSPHFDASAPWGVIGNGATTVLTASFSGNLSFLMNLPASSTVTVYAGSSQGEITTARFYGIDSGFSGFGETLAPSEISSISTIPTPAAAPLGVVLMVAIFIGRKIKRDHRMNSMLGRRYSNA